MCKFNTRTSLSQPKISNAKIRPGDRLDSSNNTTHNMYTVLYSRSKLDAPLRKRKISTSYPSLLYIEIHTNL